MMLRNWTLVPCPHVAGARGPPHSSRADCDLPTPTPTYTHATRPRLQCGEHPARRR